MSLGNRIYTLRSGLGLSQGALAEKLKVSRQAVSKWENDSAAPELEKLAVLAEVLGVTLDQLAAGEALPEAPPPQTETGGAVVLLSAGQLAALLLFVVGAAWAFLSYWEPEAWPFTVTLSCLLCGLLCLRSRRGPALWCAWAVYLTFDIAISNRKLTNWWTLLVRDWHGVYGFQRYDPGMWLQLAGVLAVFAFTVWQTRREPLRLAGRQRRRWMAAAWVAVCVAVAGLLALRGWFSEQEAAAWAASFGPDGWRWDLCRGIDRLLCRRGQIWTCLLGAALALTFARTAPDSSEKRSLAERICTLRTAQNLSQGALADLLGVSRQSVSKWETGNATPELEKLLALSRQFGVSLEQLVGKGPLDGRAATVLPWGRVAGLALLMWSAFELFRWVDYSEWNGLLAPVLLLAGGAVCLYWPRRAGLWCAWTGALLFLTFMQSTVFDASPRLLLLRTESAAPGRCLFVLAVQAALLQLTVYAFRRTELLPRRGWLLGGWTLWVLLEALLDLWVYPVTRPRGKTYLWNHVMFRSMADAMSLLLLAALLTMTAAALRKSDLHKKERNKTGRDRDGTGRTDL